MERKMAILALGAMCIDDIIEHTELARVLVEPITVDFCELSPRVVIGKNKLDFEFACHNDTEEDFKRKFYKYLDSQHLTLLEKIVEAINALDRPQDVDLVAGLVIDEETQKKSSKKE
jgi:hypothetical protein